MMFAFSGSICAFALLHESWFVLPVSIVPAIAVVSSVNWPRRRAGSHCVGFRVRDFESAMTAFAWLVLAVVLLVLALTFMVNASRSLGGAVDRAQSPFTTNQSPPCSSLRARKPPSTISTMGRAVRPNMSTACETVACTVAVAGLRGGRMRSRGTCEV